MKPQLSIVIAVLDSHRVVKRQIKYFKLLELPDSIEIIFIDDGSDPPLHFPGHGLRNFEIYPSGDKRPWSQACARNRGAKIAEGEYLLMTDIDHILTREAIAAVHCFGGDKMRFGREYGVLSHSGRIDRRPETLFRYGLDRKQYARRGLKRVGHTNSFAIRSDVYQALGGYDPRYCNRPTTGNKGDRYFHNLYQRLAQAGALQPTVMGPVIYTYPGLPEDPLELFHQLPRYHKDGRRYA